MPDNESRDMQGHLPPAAQERYEDMQEFQAEAEEVVEKKSAAEAELDDAKSALEALEAADDDTTVYQTIGKVRFNVDPAETQAELEERVEELEAEIESLEAEKERLEEQFENCKEDIKHLLGGAGGDPNTPGTGD
jgi:prefoldin beta subunit